MKSLNLIDFFDGYWSYLEENKIPSVILHSWQEYPENIASDVDYCVPQEQLHQIIPLLDSYCRQNGWSLCQVFQHERTAYFCVCTSNDKVDDLIMLDVCGDYTVRGVRRIGSEVLIENRVSQKDKSFFVLNEQAELAYIVTKAAAKKKDPDTVMPRIESLLSALDERERDEVLQYLPHNNKLDGQALYADLSQYLSGSEWSQHVGAVRGSGYFELIRKIRRVLQPTGFSVLVVYQDREDAEQAVSMLEKALVGTYRRSMAINSRDGKKLAIRCKIYLAQVKSTLVVQTAPNSMRQEFDGFQYSIQLPACWSDGASVEDDVRKWALDIRSAMSTRTRKRWIR